MNTDTPRTDEAAVDVWRKSNGERMETSSDKVDADFARRLERERDEWKAKYIDLKSQLTQTQGCVTISRNGYVQELERELAEAHAEIKLLKTNLEISFRQTEQAVQDRADEHQILTAQRDRLAEALNMYAWPCSDEELSHHCCSASPSFSVEAQREMKRRKALQSLTTKP
jgi:hypothetical protein